MTHIARFLGRTISLRFMPAGWRVTAFAALGVTAGMGLFVFHVSRASSYLSDAPETCMNCHVMTAQYVTWQHSSHGRVATCNDCHVPHNSVVSQYGFKAKDGMWHSTVFTMRWEPQVIRLSQRAVPVVENNCRRCHGSVVSDVAAGVHKPGDLHCWECHRDVPHGTVRSLSAVPDVFQPRLPSVQQAIQEPAIGGRPARPPQGAHHE
jgi:cytochrome c nitrite reductase small subunit